MSKKTVFVLSIMILVMIVLVTIGGSGKIPTPGEVQAMIADNPQAPVQTALQEDIQPIAPDNPPLPWVSLLLYAVVVLFCGIGFWVQYKAGVITSIEINVEPLRVKGGEIPSVSGKILIKKSLRLMGALGRSAYIKNAQNLIETKAITFLQEEATGWDLQESGVKLVEAFKEMGAETLDIPEDQIGYVILGGVLIEVNYDEATERMLRAAEQSKILGTAHQAEVKAFIEGTNLSFGEGASMLAMQKATQNGLFGENGLTVNLSTNKAGES